MKDPEPPEPGGGDGLVVIAGETALAFDLFDAADGAGWDVATPEEADGELPGLEGPGISAAECAVGIADALEADGFEFFVPTDLQDHVNMKNADVGGWIELMAALGRDIA